MLDILIVCLCAVNIISFIVCALDKRRARIKKRRIPERNLLLIGFLFGGFGLLAGMVICRHKTKHLRFVILAPVFCILQTFAILLAIKYNII